MQVCAKCGAEVWRFTHSISIYPDLTNYPGISRVYLHKMSNRVLGVRVTYTRPTVTALLEYVCITFMVWLSWYRTTFTPMLYEFSKWHLAGFFRVLDMHGTDLGSHKQCMHYLCTWAFKYIVFQHLLSIITSYTSAYTLTESLMSIFTSNPEVNHISYCAS